MNSAALFMNEKSKRFLHYPQTWISFHVLFKKKLLISKRISVLVLLSM
jgi:hypothetical protein